MHIECSFAFSSRQSSRTPGCRAWAQIPQKKRSPCSLPRKIPWNLLACTYMRTRRERNAQLRRFEFRILSRRFARTGELQFNQAVLGNIPCTGSMAARYQGTSISGFVSPSTWTSSPAGQRVDRPPLIGTGASKVWELPLHYLCFVPILYSLRRPVFTLINLPQFTTKAKSRRPGSFHLHSPLGSLAVNAWHGAYSRSHTHLYTRHNKCLTSGRASVHWDLV